ncbi:MAG: uroporphyrinogen-III synthase [Acidobacteriota bacterium]
MKEAETEKSLCGRTIILTRPRDQSAEMASLLENLGAMVLSLPTIQIVEPMDWSGADRAIARLDGFNWIIFTSANGVDFFFRRLIEKNRSFPSPGPAICSIGPATAKALQKAGAASDLTAEDSKAEGVLHALIERVGEERIRGLRFLIPRARVARDLLPDELTRLGAQVEAVEVYQTIKPDLDRRDIENLFREKKPDAIVFTSSSTISNLAAMANVDDLSSLLQNTMVACIGPVTAATAREYGLRDVIQPASYNARALVDAIVEALSKKAAQ